jgi:hypothetical protein
MSLLELPNYFFTKRHPHICLCSIGISALEAPHEIEKNDDEEELDKEVNKKGCNVARRASCL